MGNSSCLASVASLSLVTKCRNQGQGRYASYTTPLRAVQWTSSSATSVWHLLRITAVSSASPSPPWCQRRTAQKMCKKNPHNSSQHFDNSKGGVQHLRGIKDVKRKRDGGLWMSHGEPNTAAQPLVDADGRNCRDDVNNRGSHLGESGRAVQLWTLRLAVFWLDCATVITTARCASLVT